MRSRIRSEKSIKAKVFAGYGLLIVLTVFIAFITHRSFQNLTHSADKLAEPNKNIILLHDIIFSIYQAESHIRTYTLTQEESYIDLYFQELERIDNLVDTLYLLTETDDFFSQKVDSINVLLIEKIELLEKFISLKSDESSSIFYELALNKINRVTKVSSQEIQKETIRPDELVEEITEPEVSIEENAEVEIADNRAGRRNFFQRVRDLFSGKNEENEENIQVEEEIHEKTADLPVNEIVIDYNPRLSNEKLRRDIENILNNVKRLAIQHQRRITEQENEILLQDKQIMDRIWAYITLLENHESQKAAMQAIEAHNTVKSSSSTIIMVLLLCFLILVVFLWMISYDIAKSRYYRRELIAQIERAENLIKIKQRFMANMSHEVRTPLGAIIGFTNQMQRTDLKNDQVMYAEAIQKSSHHLLGIVNDILDFSKIEAGKLVLENIPVDLNELVLDVHRTLEILAEEKELDFSVDLDNLHYPFVYGDPLRIKQVLINLVGNALKFTEKGYVRLMAISSENPQEPDFIYLSMIVEDSGPGIAPEKQTEIFEEFAQAESQTSRKHGGTGLGLSISARLVELMSGNIELKSTLGAGSTFIINFKLRKHHDPNPILITRELAEGIKKDKKSRSRINSNKKIAPVLDNGVDEKPGNLKVLLVEDKCTNQMVISMMLKEMGCRVDLAENGQVALDMIKPGAYDIVFMDIQMPVMDGTETLKRLKESFTSEELPYIIGLSGKAMKGDAEYFISLGMNDYLTKPVSIDTLSDCLQRWSEKVNS
jgi:signal transduction histidine kinase/ActR/RegA family two-component response regulator